MTNTSPQRHFSIAVLSCAMTAISAYAQSATQTASNVSTVPHLEQRDARYKVQSQDTLQVSFPLSPELNQVVIVQPDGYITLQSGGSIFVRNMTTPEISQALKAKYTGTLRDPIIDVDLKDFQKPFFVVSGEVAKPGQYDLRSDITVTQAISIAGGMSLASKGQVFLLRRNAEGWYKVRKINVGDIYHGKSLAEDAKMEPGDLIYVPDKFIIRFRQYVPYSFNLGTYINPDSL